MKLSVIIVTYNSEKDIYDCLQSLYKYNDLPQDELEVIVVDNQSRDYEAMRARLTTDYPAVRVVQNTHNGGYGQGNNLLANHFPRKQGLRQLSYYVLI